MEINFECYSTPVENLEKMSDEDMMTMLHTLENCFDVAFVNHLLSQSTMPQPVDDFTEVDPEQLSAFLSSPFIDVMRIYISPILGIEEELTKRNKLKEYRETHPMIDFDTGDMFTYDSFFYRLAHLIELYFRGFITKSNVDSVISKLEIDNSQDKEMLDEMSEELSGVLH